MSKKLIVTQNAVFLVLQASNDRDPIPPFILSHNFDDMMFGK